MMIPTSGLGSTPLADPFTSPSTSSTSSADHRARVLRSSASSSSEPAMPSSSWMVSRCAVPFRRQTTARRLTATFGSRAARSWSSGRNALTSPGWLRERPSSAMSAEPRAAGLSSSSPLRRSWSFCRNRNCAMRGRPGRGCGVSRHARLLRSPHPTAKRSLRERTLVAGLRECVRLGSRIGERQQPVEVTRWRAYVPRGRPEEPAGSLLLQDVRRPAGDPRAGEHRRREGRRNLRDIQDECRVVLDVRLQRPLGMPPLELRQRGFLELARRSRSAVSRAHEQCA